MQRNHITQEKKKMDSKSKSEKRENTTEISCKLSDRENFKIWIKTLISSMKTFPEIIKTIDKIIELQASTITFMSDIYSSSGSTFDQAEEIIDLSERKKNILNIYLMMQTLLKNTDREKQEFLIKKFYSKYTNEELANEYNLSVRSIYRKTEKIIDELCKKSQEKNWTLKFIESQIKNEFWLNDKFRKMKNEYIKCLGMESDCQSKSSSES